MYTFQASVQDGTSQIEHLLTGFCCAITTLLLDTGSLERPRVSKRGRLAPCCVEYRNLGSNTSKSMYSPLMMRCFILSGRSDCCTSGVAGVEEGRVSIEVTRGACGYG